MKKQIRQQMIQQLKQMNAHTYKERCEKIMARLWKEPSIIEGKTIAVTMSAFPEVETRAIIASLWQQGKRVAVPKSEPKARAMQFYELTSFTQLETVYLHIEEPIPTVCNPVAKHEIDTIIVPGVVFNQAGYRIGFGGGYYDRYLPGMEATKIALAFDEQILDQIPTDAHDIPVDYIVTDQRSICARNERKKH